MFSSLNKFKGLILITLLRKKIKIFETVTTIRKFSDEKKSSLYLSYAFGTPERQGLDDALLQMGELKEGIPCVIGKEEIYSGDEQEIQYPYNHKERLTTFHYANSSIIEKAIEGAMAVQNSWSRTKPEERIAIWLKCADIIENEDRHMINAALMTGQAKPIQQAERDTSRLIESIRVYTEFLTQLLSIQHKSYGGLQQTYNVRPLDGFIAVMTPNSSLCISASLAFCPALMGNCILWKPARDAVLSCYMVFQAMIKAGLPPGVVNFLPTNSKLFMHTCSKSPYFSGVNMAGSVQAYRDIQSNIALRRAHYKCLPCFAAECGGNNFHFIHQSANLDCAVDCTIKASFAFSGQNGDSCRRLYVPCSMWDDFCCRLETKVMNLKIGDSTDFTCYTSALINGPTYEQVVSEIQYAKNNPNCKLIYGGDFCKTIGYFVEPTLLEMSDPYDRLMSRVSVGPILCCYPYPDLNEIFDIIANSASSAYTCSIFCTEDEVTCKALNAFRMAASTIYINEKCTGADFSQMPFGGNRLSGTNDKTGSLYQLLRWCSLQMVLEKLPDKKGTGQKLCLRPKKKKKEDEKASKDGKAAPKDAKEAPKDAKEAKDDKKPCEKEASKDGKEENQPKDKKEAKECTKSKEEKKEGQEKKEEQEKQEVKEPRACAEMKAKQEAEKKDGNEKK